MVKYELVPLKILIIILFMRIMIKYNSNVLKVMEWKLQMKTLQSCKYLLILTLARHITMSLNTA